MRSFLPFAALLGVALVLGCQDVGTGPDGLAPQFAKGGIPGAPVGGGSDDPETFDVSIRTVEGDVDWTAGPQEVQAGNAKGWLHLFDSGGAGTRGNPNYANAAFTTSIFFKPNDDAGCVGHLPLFPRLNQDPRDVVFDVQFGYEDPYVLFFLFRWKEVDGSVFSVSTGRGSDTPSPLPTAKFLGDGDNSTNPDLIDDPTKTRIFEISGGRVEAREFDKRKVIAMLDCPNLYTYEVTVAPHVT